MVLLDVNNPFKDLLEHGQKIVELIPSETSFSLPKLKCFELVVSFTWFLRGSIHFVVFRNLYHLPVVTGQIFVRGPSTIEAKLSIYTDL